LWAPLSSVVSGGMAAWEASVCSLHAAAIGGRTSPHAASCHVHCRTQKFDGWYRATIAEARRTACWPAVLHWGPGCLLPFPAPPHLPTAHPAPSPSAFTYPLPWLPSSFCHSLAPVPPLSLPGCLPTSLTPCFVSLPTPWLPSPLSHSLTPFPLLLSLHVSQVNRGSDLNLEGRDAADFWCLLR
jgi:hypothetical protein